MKLSVISSSSIKVTWGRPNCRDRNGEITGYLVKYGEKGSGEKDRTIKMVSRVATPISGLTKETVYTFEVAAVTSAGTGVYSHPLTIETPDSEHSFHWMKFIMIYDLYIDVYLSLNDGIIPNHGYVDISDIGSTGSTALLCHTNYIRTGTHSGGDWFTPNGTRINEDDVKGLTRNRGSKVVRLKKTTGLPPEGMYWCSIEDASSTMQTIFVGLYNHGRGMYSPKVKSVVHCFMNV